MIYLSNVRLSFPALVEPRAPSSTPDAVKKYSADFILDQAHPGLAEFMKEYGRLAVEKWGENAQAVMQMVQADRKLRCYGSGSERINKKTFKVYDGYEGKYYIGANRVDAPQMIRPDGTSVEVSNTMEYQALARKLYGGCMVNAAINPWLQSNAFGNGIRCDLVAVQFLADAEPFGEGAADAAPMFGAVAGAPAAAGAVPAFAMPPFAQ